MLAIAEALDRQGTLTGQEIDQAIAVAETKADYVTELARRTKWAKTLASAENVKIFPTISEDFPNTKAGG